MKNKWGRIEDGHIVYFSGSLQDDKWYLIKPTADDFRRLGWMPVIDIHPATPAPDGYYYKPSGWSVIEGEIRREYTLVPIPPPPPRRWSRLSLKTALAKKGLLAAAKTFFDTNEIEPGYTLAEALADCDYIEEGWPDAARWNTILDGIAAALKKPRKEIDTFLDTLPAED